MSARVVGAWELETFELVDAAGASRPWGDNVLGLLIYEPGSHMSVSITRSPPVPKPSDWEAMDDVLFYAGTYCERESGTVEHVVVVATDRERIGQTLSRTFKLAGDALTLSNSTASGGTA